MLPASTTLTKYLSCRRFMRLPRVKQPIQLDQRKLRERIDCVEQGSVDVTFVRIVDWFAMAENRSAFPVPPMRNAREVLRPQTSFAISRSLNFCTLPVEVLGNSAN